jgi:citrate lyase subunit beta/citryl-CoA lyase
MHPSEILFQGKRQPIILPACDHYAGAEKLMRKSVSLQQELGPIFDITFDCEDGAAAGNEAQHARMIGALIASPENHFKRIGARLHDVTSSFFEQDCALICQAGAANLAYLVVPKVNGVADTQHAISVINQHAKQAGRDLLPVHVLIETHGALADAFAIAALPEVECLSFGIMDFVSDHHGAIPGDVMNSPRQFTHPLIVRAKTQVAAACHAYGKIASHNVTTDFTDGAQAGSDAKRAAAEFGYTRMWSIHPNQIKPIVLAFTPGTDEIHAAIAILTEAQRAQWGPIQQNGRLYDRASYRYFWTVLRRAKLSGLPLPESAVTLL